MMSVHSQRRKINASLSHALGDQFVIAAAPDHPLLLKGPDLLIGGPGGIAALLLPSALERRQPKLALARFALCRFALPEATNFILVAAYGDEQVADQLTNSMAAVVISENQKGGELTRLVAEPKRLGQRPVPEKLREKVKSRFGDLYRVARVVSRGRNRLTPTAPNTEDQELIDRQPKYIKRTADISALTITGADASFIVDNGVPYLTGIPAEAAVIEKLPSYPGDPMKYIRASAFSGWVLSESGNPSLNDGMRILDRRGSQ